MRGRGTGATPPEIIYMLRCAVNGRVASHVAKAIGISTGQLHRYMEGEGYPERNTLQRIVNYCGIPFTIKPEVK